MLNALPSLAPLREERRHRKAISIILGELKDPEKRPRLGLGWFGLEEELSRILGREVELIAEGSLSPYLRPYAEKDLVLLYEEG